MDSLVFSPSLGSRLAASANFADSTTKAAGTSCEYGSGMPTTPTSATASCPRRKPSSSAGATWKPRTLKISLRRSTIKRLPSYEGSRLISDWSQHFNPKTNTYLIEIDLVSSLQPSIYKRLPIRLHIAEIVVQRCRRALDNQLPFFSNASKRPIWLDHTGDAVCNEPTGASWDA